jgi:outer membrane protein assembly factor BamB
MKLLKRLFKFAAILTVAFVAIGLATFALGGRVVMDGGGGLHLRFPESAAARERVVQAHRKAQEAVPPQLGSPGPLDTVTVLPTNKPLPVDSDYPSPLPKSTEWTDFRGPRRDGRYEGSPLRAKWPVDGLKPLWKQPIGEGYASFVISDGRAFTIEQRGEREVVAAYDVKTGRQIWTNTWTAAFREFMGGDGPRATPTFAEGLLYALGAQGELRCLEAATGRVIWRTNILDDAGAGNVQWGMAAAPLLVDDTVVVHPGGPDGKSVVAYNKRTGVRVWSSQNDAAGYASPILATIAGVRQIVVFTATRLMGLKPEDGSFLWDYPWRTQADINASQPLLIGDNRVFVSSGYGVGAAVLELSREGSAFKVREVWRNTKIKNRFNSSVLKDGYIYGFDESIMACVDAATGDLKWKGGRYGYGQLLLAGDQLVVLTEEGELVLVRATPDGHQELARFEAISGKTWNHPAITDGLLLVRNLREMAAFDLQQK